MPKYFPRPLNAGFAATTQDFDFADYFVNLAAVLECTPNSEAVAVLLSTCRNHYLAINALYIDLRCVFGHGENPSPLSRCLYDLHREDLASVRKSLDEVFRGLAAFDSKVEVWTRREELHDQFQTCLAQLEHEYQSARLRHMLENSRLPTDRLGDEYNSRYYALDFQERPDLSARFDTLIQIARAARGVASIARIIAGILSSILAPRLDENVEAQRDQLHDALVGRAADLQWTVVQENGVRRIRSSETLFGEVILADTGDLESARLQCLDLARLLQVVEGSLYTRLADPNEFNPNIGRPPLPPMFVLDLSYNPIDRFDHKHQIAEARYIDVRREPSNPSAINLGLLCCPIDPSCYNLQSLRFDESRRREVQVFVDSVMTASAQFARDRSIDVLVAPEYFLPDESVAASVEKMKNAEVVFISGQEARPFSNGRMQARALIAIPGANTTWVQLKQYPSPYEFRDDGRWSRDGIVNIFESTGIGTFAVLVCHDLLELDVLTALSMARRDIDILFVPCYNPYGKHFQDVGKASAMQFYSYVAIANTQATAQGLSSDGSAIIGPFRDESHTIMKCNEEELTVAGPRPRGFGDVRILWQRVSLEDIRSREREKPSTGLLAPPWSRIARR